MLAIIAAVFLVLCLLGLTAFHVTTGLIHFPPSTFVCPYQGDAHEEYAKAQEELAESVSQAKRRAEIQTWELIRN